jgi:hypothetical protein
LKENTDHEIGLIDIRNYPMPGVQKVFTTVELINMRLRKNRQQMNLNNEDL